MIQQFLTPMKLLKGNKNLGPQKDYMWILLAELFIKAPNSKQLKGPLKGKWINKCEVDSDDGIVHNDKKK